MMFKGSKNVADGQHWALLEAAGGRAGADINGTTSWDRTNYFEQIPSNQLELALWLESDRMGTLTQTLDAGKARQPARGGEKRAPPERRQPALRHLGREDGRAAVPRRSSVPSLGDRLDDGPVRTLPSPTSETSSRRTTRPTTPCSWLPVTSMSRRRRRWCASISRRSRVARPHRPSPRMTLPATVGREQRVVVQDQQAPAPAVYRRVPRPAREGSAAPRLSAFSATSWAAGGRHASMNALVRRQQVATNVAGFNFGSRRWRRHACFHGDRKARAPARTHSSGAARRAGRRVELHAAGAGARARIGALRVRRTDFRPPVDSAAGPIVWRRDGRSSTIRTT